MPVFEVMQRFMAITDRRKLEMEFQAACLGAKIGDGKDDVPDHRAKISDDDLKRMEADVERRLLEKGMKRHGR